MDEYLSAEWVAEAEQLIKTLRDVIGVDITVEDGELLEINILATGDRAPRMIARDVRSALKAQLRVDVDHRKISVAQRRDESGAAGLPGLPAMTATHEPAEPHDPPVIDLVPHLAPASAARRLQFLNLDLSKSPHRTLARVELALGTGEAAGEAEGPSTQEESLRLIARATLVAVQRFTGEDTQFALVDLKTIAMGDDTAILVGIHHQNGRERQMLSGSATAGRDLQTSVVFATLAALNRRLGRLPVREAVEYELRPTLL